MSTIPITEVVPRISQQLTLLVSELLDAHDDTARLAADLAPDVRWGGAPGLFARSPAPGTRGAGTHLNWSALMTTRAASQSAPALEPVRNYAFMYEAADIRPGITIGEFRSQRSGTRGHRRGLHAWLRRLLSRGQGWASARCEAPRRRVAGATGEVDLR